MNISTLDIASGRMLQLLCRENWTTSVTSQPLIERRRFTRLDCRTAVQYRDLVQPREPYAGGLTKDISAGGLMFETAQFFSHQHRLLIQLTLPSRAALIRAVTQVMWVRKRPHDDRYDIGLRFIEITVQDQETVASHVERGIRISDRPSLS